MHIICLWLSNRSPPPLLKCSGFCRIFSHWCADHLGCVRISMWQHSRVVCRITDRGQGEPPLPLFLCAPLCVLIEASLHCWCFWVLLIFFHQCADQWAAGGDPCVLASYAGCVEARSRLRWAFSPSSLSAAHPKSRSPVCPIEVLIWGGFAWCLFFGDGHGVGYSCALPRFDFLQLSAEYVLGSF